MDPDVAEPADEAMLVAVALAVAVAVAAAVLPL
jgi:hypothetical protein